MGASGSLRFVETFSDSIFAGVEGSTGTWADALEIVERDECRDPAERWECVLDARWREPLGASDK